MEKQEYFIVSVHREENVDNQDNLKKIIEILNRLAEEYKIPVIVSTHPRTRKSLASLDKSHIRHHALHFLKPFGFFEYNFLQLNAKCAISDSGTISEESAILNFPAITIRKSMERPEAMDAGTIILSGLDPNIIIDSIEIAINTFNRKNGYNKINQNYQIGNTSLRALKTILGTTNLSNDWWGVKK